MALALTAFAAAPAAQGATSVTLVFTSYTTITKTLDVAPRGKPNRGDKIEFKDLLVATSNQLGKKKGKPIGYDAGTVLYTSATTQMIEGVTTIPGVGTLTFGEIHARSNALAHAFADAGIVEGDGVAIMCRNHRGFIDATVACSKVGANALYLNTAFAGPQITDWCGQLSWVMKTSSKPVTPTISPAWAS